MRILITDRHTSGDEHIEKDAVGPDIELEFFDHHDDVTVGHCQEKYRHGDLRLGVLGYSGSG